MNYNLLIIFLLINIPLIFFYKKLIIFFNLYDKPDKNRKLQKKPVPLTGGLIIIYNFIIFSFINFFFDIKLFDIRFLTNNQELLVIFVFPLIFYFFGYLDDKYNINANTKFIILSILIILAIFLDDRFVINELNFSFLKHPIKLINFSIFVTLLCCLLFINALNMLDGIDLQVGTYVLIIFVIFIIKSILVNLFIILILSTLLFLYYNYKNKSYLGNSGVIFFGYLIAYSFIKTNNLNPNYFKADEIFIIMILPGLDLLRLFFYRIFNGKHPFKGDRNHIHHLLLKFFSEKKTYFIIQLFIIFSIIGYYLLYSKLYFIIILIFFYILLVYLLKKIPVTKNY
jgi:UDP-GlcNAc:undecaprenyl-phosphate GlcNAc-1-phosphate transferase